MKFIIKNRWTNSVLFEVEADSAAHMFYKSNDEAIAWAKDQLK